MEQQRFKKSFFMLLSHWVGSRFNYYPKNNAQCVCILFLISIVSVFFSLTELLTLCFSSLQFLKCLHKNVFLKLFGPCMKRCWCYIKLYLIRPDIAYQHHQMVRMTVKCINFDHPHKNSPHLGAKIESRSWFYPAYSSNIVKVQKYFPS